MTWRSVTLVIGIGLVLAGEMLAQDRSKIDCNATFQFSASKVGIKADILKKVGLELNVDKETLAKLTEWSSVALAQQRSLCDIYKRTNENTFSTEKYLEELDKLRAWDMEFSQKVIRSQVDLCKAKDDAAQQKGKAGTDVNLQKARTNLKEDVKELLQAKPPALPSVGSGV